MNVSHVCLYNILYNLLVLIISIIFTIFVSLTSNELSPIPPVNHLLAIFSISIKNKNNIPSVSTVRFILFKVLINFYYISCIILYHLINLYNMLQNKVLSWWSPSVKQAVERMVMVWIHKSPTIQAPDHSVEHSPCE